MTPEELRRHVRHFGASQRQFAERFGYSRSAIGLMISGKTPIPQVLVMAIAGERLRETVQLKKGDQKNDQE